MNHGLFVRAGHNTYNAAFESAMIRFLRPDGSGIGSITQSSVASVAFNTSSDMRLKENIQDTKFGLNDIMQIQVSDYNYKNDSNHMQTGYIAQQLHAIFPDAVHVGSDDVENDPWMVDYGRITPLLVKGMQDQQKMIDSQAAVIAQQSLRLEALEKQIEKLLHE